MQSNLAGLQRLQRDEGPPWMDWQQSTKER